MGLKHTSAGTAWRLARCYWTSEQRWSAWALLLTVLVLNLGNVFVSVRINAWNRSFYNALAAFDSGSLFAQLAIFCILVAFAISMSVYGQYLSQMLQIRWRRWLTGRYLEGWLEEGAYYQLELTDKTDNPDQRISEDIQQFTAYVLSLSIGLISSIASLSSFLAILWGLSGPGDIPIGKWTTLHIPGYLVWAALLYAGIGTYLTIIIGRPLVLLNYARQRSEADLRFSLVRFRENAEAPELFHAWVRSGGRDLSSDRAGAALFPQADRPGRFNAGGERVFIRAELSVVHHQFLFRHRCMAGSDQTARKF